jgi:hypothetical protein
MYHELKAYHHQTDQAIVVLEADMSALEPDETKARTALQQKAQQLADYHAIRVRDFQHERLIHLLVTFFFGFLFLGSLAGFLAASMSWWTMPLLTILAGILSGLLFLTELAYIRHYYQLENGVQSLYMLTKRLQALR